MNFCNFGVLGTFLDLWGILLFFQYFKIVLESAQKFVRSLFSKEKNDFQTPSVALQVWKQQQTDRQTIERQTTYR